MSAVPTESEIFADDAPWAAAARAVARTAWATLPVPSGSEEDWRYTDPGRFPLLEPPAVGAAGEVAVADVVAQATAVADAYGPRAALLVTTATRSVVAEAPAAGSGLTVGPLTSDADAAVAAVAGSLLAADDRAAALVVAQGRGGACVRAARGATPDAPVVIVHLAAPAETAPARSLIVAESTAELDVIEIWAGGGAGAFVPAIVELVVGDTARLRHMAVQDVDDATTHLGQCAAVVGRDGRLAAAAALLGAATTRLTLDVDLAGEGADAELVGAYLGDDSRHVDLRTRQHHTASRTTSRLRYHGAVAGSSSSIFSGVIRIEADAAHTDAQQASHYLVLSETAHAASIPNLEILNHDTSCGHAASGGPPDPEQLYYLAARGIAPDVARRLIVDGFFADIVARLPLAAVRDRIGAAITQRLELDRKG